MVGSGSALVLWVRAPCRPVPAAQAVAAAVNDWSRESPCGRLEIKVADLDQAQVGGIGGHGDSGGDDVEVV